MDETFTGGYLSFIIRGVDLDSNEITRNINFIPSEIKRKRETIIKNKKMQDSYWSYQLEYEGYDNLYPSLEKLLYTLPTF
ncbi:DUF4279 domain-containing protein [Bacillus sp. 7884-1]|uniref:DUF4279 domain-containing protein n=1 Tax=Bacillus sp. 7884-1 TaxID=2021693 RepID=UPI000BA6CB10|nr:DUF4279 domain-containing protein [Bacillus sp. 7884-1]PAE35417.1 hypothetical protein CHI06_23485 [Bacillus sp. 7884-1]